VTVRDWVTERTVAAPRALVREMLDALAADAELPVTRTADVCIAAASRTLDALIAEQRFERPSAIALLAVDALTTLAFEFAAERGTEVDGLADAAARGIKTLSASSLARV
jgi:hypothetical protein